MTDNSTAHYSFLPWLRQGIAANIKHTDNLAEGASGQAERTQVEIKLEINQDAGAPVSNLVKIYGPGDITAMDHRAVVRTDPKHWVTDLEPNYLPLVEFYDEDFPWRYTPASATEEHRLRPWICLIVLAEGEFERINTGDGPLPVIKVFDPSAVLPDPKQVWAWAHVHFNEKLPSVIKEALTQLEDRLEDNPDLGISRLLCPRKLRPGTAYNAFVIPTFETGRLAGLGQAIPKEIDGLAPAWGQGQDQFPVYYEWYFRTGERGDFEYLVDLLEPRKLDKRIGIRDMDVQEPGFGVEGITDPPVLGLEGALKTHQTESTEWPLSVFLFSVGLEFQDDLEAGGLSPNFRKAFESHGITLSDDLTIEPHAESDTWRIKENDTGRMYVVSREGETLNIYLNGSVLNVYESVPFLSELVDLVNLPEDLCKQGNTKERLVTPPLYGRWHAAVKRLLALNNPVWLDQLNLDPRHRAVAGLGTRVVQTLQEELMNQAWQQVGRVEEANRRLKQAQLAREVTLSLYKRHVLPLDTNRTLGITITAPVHAKVLFNPVTVRQKIEDSILPEAMVDPAFRRTTRPRGPVIKKIAPDPEAEGQLAFLLQRVNDDVTQEKIMASFPKQAPTEQITLDEVAEAAGIADEICESLLTPDLLVDIEADQLDQFRITFPDEYLGGITPYHAGGDISEEDTPPANNVVAANFVQAASQLHEHFQDYKSTADEQAEAKVEPLPFDAVQNALFTALDPVRTIPQRVLKVVNIPASYQSAQRADPIAPIMAAPDFPRPMYEALRDISDELLIPNLKLLPQNTIALLETNQRFVEAYLVGLNHEMSRELLWREYPTDQRGSYFRQFWDVSDFIPSPQDYVLQQEQLQYLADQLGKSIQDLTDQEKLAEKLRDIRPIHTWSAASELGGHDNRRTDDGDEDEGERLVLVIRGDLLKKYPTAVIYAVKAEWPDVKMLENGTIFLFSVGLDYQSDLEAGELSSDFRQEFVSHGITLPEDLTIEPHLGSDKWRIKENDTGRTYIVSKEDETLDIKGIIRQLGDEEKYPLFHAFIESDITFFGFDLTEEEARGSSKPDDGKPGWFFVIKERPGEPRFGLDIDDTLPELEKWYDLAWNHLGDPNDINFIDLNFKPNTDKMGSPDKQIEWGSNAADMAYILYQPAALVAVHASEMLP